jgi:hypothetical protein
MSRQSIIKLNSLIYMHIYTYSNIFVLAQNANNLFAQVFSLEFGVFTASQSRMSLVLF